MFKQLIFVLSPLVALGISSCTDGLSRPEVATYNTTVQSAMQRFGDEVFPYVRYDPYGNELIYNSNLVQDGFDVYASTVESWVPGGRVLSPNMSPHVAGSAKPLFLFNMCFTRDPRHTPTSRKLSACWTSLGDVL